MKGKVLLGILAFAAFITLYFARAALLPLFLGSIFAYAFSPLVIWFEKKGLRRRLNLISG